MVDKKRKSKRLSTRKKNKIVKKIRKQDKDRRKEAILKRKSRSKIPKHILMTDEDVQRLNDIKNNERSRKELVIEKEDAFKKFLNDNEMFLVIVDPRDIYSLPKFDIFGDKPFYLVLNYKNDISLEYLFEFKKINNSFIVSKDSSDERLRNWNNEFNIFVGKNDLSVGILGEKRVGKNFVRNMVSNSKIFTLDSEQGIKSLLRGCLTMRDVLYKDLIKKLIETQIDKEKLSHHFSIQIFDSYESFVELLSEKFGIHKDKHENVAKILLDEFYKKNILFFYDLNKELQIIFK
ncbi:putative GTPase [Vairimorpha necatrix]|uniref:GTPase n=1 Tax=Vairimorpha necatrix TaxID=6039 RepID=A0AAX4JFQ4_9MICR